MWLEYVSFFTSLHIEDDTKHNRALIASCSYTGLAVIKKMKNWLKSTVSFNFSESNYARLILHGSKHWSFPSLPWGSEFQFYSRCLHIG